MLVSPKSLKGFIEDLKVLVDLSYDGAFRLTQSADPADEGGQKKQYIEISGHASGEVDVGAGAGGNFKSYVEVGCFFSESSYPKDLEGGEVEFCVDSTTCSMFLGRFAQRLGVLADEMASVTFGKMQD